MTMKNTSQFRFIHDKNSGLNHLKTVIGNPFKIENKTIVFKKAPYNRYESEGDLLEMLANPKFDERERERERERTNKTYLCK